MDQNPIHICDIKPRLKPRPLEIRVIKKWIPKFQKELCYLFIDSNGDGIEVIAELAQQEHFDEIIKVNKCYTVMEYVSVPSRKTYKVVDHEASLRIGRRATFIPISDANIPTHYFRLATHETLKLYREYPKPLADYIGRLEKRFTQHTQKGETLKKFLIQDEWANEVEITFWKDMEHLASDNILEGDIILITSTAATFYKVEQLETTRATTIQVNPSHPELATTINRLKALSPLTNNATLQQILTGNKANYKCTARIKDIEAHRTWYSAQCSKCSRKLHPQGDNSVEFVCIDHNNIEPKFGYCVNVTLIDNTTTTKAVFFNEAMNNMLNISCQKMVIENGNTDPHILPQEMVAHIGQLKLFEVAVQSNKSVVVTKATNIGDNQPIAPQTAAKTLTSMPPPTPDPKKLAQKRQHPSSTGTKDNNESKRPKTSD